MNKSLVSKRKIDLLNPLWHALSWLLFQVDLHSPATSPPTFIRSTNHEPYKLSSFLYPSFSCIDSSEAALVSLSSMLSPVDLHSPIVLQPSSYLWILNHTDLQILKNTAKGYLAGSCNTRTIKVNPFLSTYYDRNIQDQKSSSWLKVP